MSLRTTAGVLGALAGLLLVRPAQASPMSDLQAGADIFLQDAQITVDGNTYHSAGHNIAKPAGTMDIVLVGSALGINTTQSVTLHASVSGDTVVWTFDQTFNPPIGLDSSNSVNHAYGQLVAKAWLMPGADTYLCDYSPCLRNVSLFLAPGSAITVEGTGPLGIGWSRAASVDSLYAAGGVPRPNLSNVVVDPGGALCSKSVDSKLPITAFLSSVSPTGGAKVDFHTSYPEGLAVPSSVDVPGGQTSVTVDATIKANFTGLVTLSGSANGSTLSQVVEIGAPGSCDPADGGGPLVAAYVPSLLAGCTQCSALVDTNDHEEGLANISGRATLVKASQLVDVARALGLSSVQAVALSNNGMVAGTYTVITALAPVTVAFRANLENGPTTLKSLGAMTPLDINAVGTAVGYHTNSAGAVTAAYFDGQQPADLPLSFRTSVASSRATGINDQGYVIGTWVDSSGVTHGFRFFNGATLTVPVVGATPGIPLAVNEAGQMAVNGTDSAGKPVAAIVDANGAVRLLGVPSGWGPFKVNSLNRYGWAVGTATGATVDTARVTRGFLYTPQRGLVDLTSLANTRGFVVLDALRITDSNQVVVRGALNGVTDLYVLSF